MFTTDSGGLGRDIEVPKHSEILSFTSLLARGFGLESHAKGQTLFIYRGVLSPRTPLPLYIGGVPPPNPLPYPAGLKLPTNNARAPEVLSRFKEKPALFQGLSGKIKLKILIFVLIFYSYSYPSPPLPAFLLEKEGKPGAPHRAD